MARSYHQLKLPLSTMYMTYQFPHSHPGTSTHRRTGLTDQSPVGVTISKKAARNRVPMASMITKTLTPPATLAMLQRDLILGYIHVHLAQTSCETTSRW